MSLNRSLGAGLLALGLLFAPGLQAEGVDVGKPSTLRKLVPAAQLESQANQEYRQLLQEAQAKNTLVSADHPQLKRLRAIGQQIIPYAGRFNKDASRWKWEINLISSKEANAFCMPGGKIAFYTGLVDGLKLTDDEVAVVMGHEIAHALREHARARIAKSQLTQMGANLLGHFIGDGQYTSLFQLGGNLLTLKFSRNDETEADVVGLELAARAAYDPRAGISLWQKMEAANDGAPPQWLSTHPAGDNRIKEIEAQLPLVMPLYEQARRKR